jgi:hypothetical protein
MKYAVRLSTADTERSDREEISLGHAKLAAADKLRPPSMPQFDWSPTVWDN